MKLKKTAETFNLGDTSFRRKTLIDDYKTVLPYLLETNEIFKTWDNNAQAYFYERVLTESDLFERNSDEDLAKRGRTLTNALVKIGLTDNNRKLSQIALAWLDDKVIPADSIEKTLGLEINNVLFLRQLLKLRVYDADGIHYFYPFRVAIDLVCKYQNIPQKDFLILIHLIQPEMTNREINTIIENYSEVSKNNKLFSEFLDEEFPDGGVTTNIKDLFSNVQVERSEFNKVFVNRKSSGVQSDYYRFVTTLLKFKKEKPKTKETLQKLLKESKNEKVKKAFGFGKAVFVKKDEIDGFLEENQENLLLSMDDLDIYRQFVLSKKDDIVSEYRDMTKRTFNLTGLLDFSNGLVNASNQDVVKIIFSDLQLSGESEYSQYEQELEQPFYLELTLQEILKLEEAVILVKLQKFFDVEEPEKIERAVLDQKEVKFRNLIEREFPKDKILELLPLFSSRKDREIQKRVTELATVPTIYEYIVAIAWYHLSNQEFYISKSLNLTLDGNMRPLSHAAGGAGDIVIRYDKITLMLEVTLMNSQAQKRGEWEPVLRHTTNLTVNEYPKEVMTLFIADELDENTINIWRAVASVPLKSSNKNERTKLVKIFPLTNKELIKMLDSSINQGMLLSEISESYSALSGHFNERWRDEILEKSFSGKEVQ